MKVKTAVRVRPFNRRQKNIESKLCVEMFDKTTRLFADDSKNFKDFTFDNAFWSYDQFHHDQNGYFIPNGSKYADQKRVYDQVGLQILTNLWEGNNCTLSAYGQTGAGKSYTMFGNQANKGIILMFCEDLFNKIKDNQKLNKEYEVCVSMLEIYNERVNDLLIPIYKRPKLGNKIRQHKILGVYVEGLSKNHADTYDCIEEIIEEGVKNRYIAATQMSQISNRAHTIVSIQLRQKQVFEGKNIQKVSVLYFVDFAGSEKERRTGVTGDRIRQNCFINKSLSVFGLVIRTLAQRSAGKAPKGQIIPYRDSCLTRILQNALNGNSKIWIVFAISPASDNYQQTLSTLRFADYARQIHNKPLIINERETEKVTVNLIAQKNELQTKIIQDQSIPKKLILNTQTRQKEEKVGQDFAQNKIKLGDQLMKKKQYQGMQKRMKQETSERLNEEEGRSSQKLKDKNEVKQQEKAEVQKPQFQMFTSYEKSKMN